MGKRGKVLVTGATGFIGRALVRELTAAGVAVRCLSRSRPSFPAGVEPAVGDLFRPASLERALDGIDTSYYLVHSLDAAGGRFAERDRQAAENFVVAADRAGLRRTIYLSGLGEPGKDLSEHLRSRREVAAILGRGSFRLTVLRAAIIIGAGGASFETLRFLVRTQPLIPHTAGLDTRCQPIALENAVRYLAGCLEDERTAGETFDIGGPEVLTYRQMLDLFAQASGDVNLYLPLPFFSHRLVARLVGLFTPIRPQTVLALLRGMKNEVICTEQRIRRLIPQELIPYREAVRLALEQRTSEAGRQERRPA